MKARYLLLNPLKARDFGCTTEEVIDKEREIAAEVEQQVKKFYNSL